LYCIGHYHKATLEHNDELLLSGYILSEGFEDSSIPSLAAIAGYSLTGVLEDCQIPPTLYPLQSDGLTLREIAQKLIAPFKLSMVVDSSVASLMDSKYDTTTAEATQTIKEFLTSLAAQKNIIISHDEKGRLLFTRANTTRKPILHYGDGGTPFTKMNLLFNGQAMHSHITVMKEADTDGGNVGDFTIRNPYVPHVYRPRVVIQNSGDDNDTEQVAKNLLADELKNIKLTIQTDRWELDGKIIKPNNLITVVNPNVYLFKKTTWFIEQIDFVGTQESTTATLTCVLPEVYSGNVPEYIWKGINLH
jgi:prophage tail gpP-like protein